MCRPCLGKDKIAVIRRGGQARRNADSVMGRQQTCVGIRAFVRVHCGRQSRWWYFPRDMEPSLRLSIVIQPRLQGSVPSAKFAHFSSKGAA